MKRETDTRVSNFIKSDGFTWLVDGMPKECRDGKSFLKWLLKEYLAYEEYPQHIYNSKQWERVHLASKRVLKVLREFPREVFVSDNRGDVVSGASVLKDFIEEVQSLYDFSLRQSAMKGVPGRQISGSVRYYLVSAFLPYFKYKGIKDGVYWGWFEELVKETEVVFGVDSHKRKEEHEAIRQWWCKATKKIGDKYRKVKAVKGAISSLAPADGVFESAFSYLKYKGIKDDTAEGKEYLRIILEEMPFLKRCVL